MTVSNKKPNERVYCRNCKWLKTTSFLYHDGVRYYCEYPENIGLLEDNFTIKCWHKKQAKDINEHYDCSWFTPKLYFRIKRLLGIIRQSIMNKEEDL